MSKTEFDNIISLLLDLDLAYKLSEKPSKAQKTKIEKLILQILKNIYEN